MHEIIENLFLGNIDNAKDFQSIKDKKICVIVNCTKDIENFHSLNLLKPLEEAPQEIQNWLCENSYYIKYYRVPIDDSGKDKDIEDFYHISMEIIWKVLEDYKKGKAILVHCLAGNQRSASFICIFLMLYKKMSLKESINYLVEKKPSVFFFGSQVNFQNALNKIEM